MGKTPKDDKSTIKDEKSTKNSTEEKASKAEANESSLSDDIATKFEKLQDSDPDFQKFLTMLAAAGEIKPDQDLVPEEMSSIIAKFAAWNEAGQPGLSMPKLSEKEVPIPSMIVRVKQLGKQYIWWRDTKGREYDIERIPVYRKIKDMDPQSPTAGLEIDDTSNVIDTKNRYLKEYKREDAVKLVQLGIDMNPEGLHCQFRFGTQSTGYTVGPKDFNVPGPKDPRTFDDIIALHKRADYVPT